MALEFLFRSPGNPARAAVFPGAWNPPTIAHLEIARGARKVADEIVWVLPRRLPHKELERASLDDRAKLIETIARAEDGFSAALSEGELYIEIAKEARELLGPSVEIDIVCGRDAAERIASWDYGMPGVFDALLDQHRLLVATREGHYKPPKRLRKRIVPLSLDMPLDVVSSSEVRRRIAEGLPWRDLVPSDIADAVEKIYS